MNKRLGVILFCCGLLAVSLVMLLVFLVPAKDDYKTLYITAPNQEIYKNEVIENYYQLSHENAIISSIVVSKEGIIDIDENRIKGVEAGEVTVTLTATLGDTRSSTSFSVKVYANGYTVAFTPVSGCTIEGNTVYAYETTNQIQIDVYDMLNNKLSNPQFEVSVQGNGSATIAFSNMMMLNINEDCTLTIKFTEISNEIVLLVRLSTS